MENIFKKLFVKNYNKVITLTQSKEDVKKIIEQIHNEFDNSANLLLEEANKILSKESTYNIERVELLKKIGVTNCKEVIEFEEENNIKDLAVKNLKTIQYFQTYYPNNKFITDSQVNTICEKYGLIFGEINRYKGFIPITNLKEIAEFKIRKEDKTCIEIYSSIFGSRQESIINLENLKNHYNSEIYKDLLQHGRIRHNYTTYIISPLYICAPEKDMELRSDEKIINNRIVKSYPDPIVLEKVVGGNLIVSKWGDEASDPIVQNEKLN